MQEGLSKMRAIRLRPLSGVKGGCRGCILKHILGGTYPVSLYPFGVPIGDPYFYLLYRGFGLDQVLSHPDLFIYWWGFQLKAWSFHPRPICVLYPGTFSLGFPVLRHWRGEDAQWSNLPRTTVHSTLLAYGTQLTRTHRYMGIVLVAASIR